MLLKKNPSHFFFADALRALAIFAVIILHNAADYVDQFGEISTSAWWAACTWNGLVRFCVPMFVVLSGALLLRPGKDITPKEIFYNRLPKILIPLVFWSIVYVLFDNYLKGKSFGQLGIKQQLEVFYKGPVVYHLWYLYMLTGIYLLYPVMNIFITAATELQVRYFLIVWIAANCVIGMITIIFNLDIGVDLNFFTGYIGYFVLGYYLMHFKFTAKQLRLAYVLAIAGFMISIITPYLCALLNFKNRAALIESDFTFDVVLSVSGLLLFFIYKLTENKKNKFINKIIKEISNQSFGIYLIHILVMKVIFADNNFLSAKLQNMHLLWLIPLKSIIILIVSYVIIKLIKQIPVLKKVAG